MSAEVLVLTSYFGERQRVSGGFFADAQLAAFGRNQIATSILLRGVSGFGLKHHFRSDRPLTLSEDLPLVSIAVDSRPKIERLADDVRALGHRGLVTLERARLIDRVIGEYGTARDTVKLTVYVGRGELAYRVPTYQAVCELLHRRGIDAAAAVLGVDGTRDGMRVRARLAGRNVDVPTMITAIGSGDRMARVVPELGGLLRAPTVTVERVQLCKRDGRLLGYPRAISHVDGHGIPMWQKLAVYTSAGDRYEGEPVHRALVRRLWAGDCRGVTVLGGFWGFHGARRPGGDSIWRLGRGVPMCTVVVDTPQRLLTAFDAVDRITAEYGLVTSEIVPALVESAGGPARPPTLAPQLPEDPTRRGRSIARWNASGSAGRGDRR